MKKRLITIESVESVRDELREALEVFEQLAAGTFEGKRRDIIRVADRLGMTRTYMEDIAWWHDDSKGTP
jgi:hypothetical protein